MDIKEKLQPILADLQAQKEALLEQTRPLRRQHDALAKEIQAREADLRALVEQIHALERPQLADLDNQIATVANAMGGRRLSAPQPDA